jgi:hypothetical protein
VSSASAPVLEDLELYTRIYRQMLLIRGFEDLVQALFLKSEVYGTTHLYSRAATALRRPIGGTVMRWHWVSTRRRSSTRCSAARPA